MGKLELCGFPDGKKVFNRFDIKLACDRQTDRQTAMHTHTDGRNRRLQDHVQDLEFIGLQNANN